MTDEDDREFKAELMRLQQEHRDLDAAIAALQLSPAPDLLQLQRLKKRKLQLRDRIAFIEDQIKPDIIAWRRLCSCCVAQPWARTWLRRPARARVSRRRRH